MLKAEDSVENVEGSIHGIIEKILENRQHRFDKVKNQLVSKIQLALEDEKKALEIAAEQHNESIHSARES